MKGFYWGSNGVRCGFCATVGHNVTTCSAVNHYARQALMNMESNPSYICSRKEHAAMMELKKREERKVKQRKPRQASKCSYCKSLSHKRPRCQDLKDFKKLVYTANKNWKQVFAERANEVGVGVGSLIQFDEKTVYNLDFNVDVHRIAMVTQYNLNNLNVFCALEGYSEYQSNSTVQVLSGDRADNISVKYFSALLGYDLLHQGWWYSHGTPKVLSPMPFQANKEWLDSEWDEVFNWFFKDINGHDLNNRGLITFIEKWADKI